MGPAGSAHKPNRRVMENPRHIGRHLNSQSTGHDTLLRNSPNCSVFSDALPLPSECTGRCYPFFLSGRFSEQTVGLDIAPLVAKPLQPLCWYRRRKCDELGFSGFLNL